MKTLLRDKTQIAAASAPSQPSALAALEKACENSVNLLRKPLPMFEAGGSEFQIPRYLFVGPKGGAEPIRVGLFAGLHGDEPEGTFALTESTLLLDQNPHLARDYFLFIYPVVNPSGFANKTHHTASGANIGNELWKNSTCPEVQQIQTELWMHAFDGIVSLKTDPRAAHILIEVGGPVFARHLFDDRLALAQDILPQCVHSGPDTLPPFRGVLLNKPNEIIRAAPGVRPRPFELVITIPGRAPTLQQRTAVALLLQTVLTEYRKFIAFGANI